MRFDHGEDANSNHSQGVNFLFGEWIRAGAFRNSHRARDVGGDPPLGQARRSSILIF